MNSENSNREVLERILSKYNLVSKQNCVKILEIYDKNRADFVNQIISRGYLRTPRFFLLVARELNLEYCSYQRLFKNRDKVRIYPYSLNTGS